MVDDRDQEMRETSEGRFAPVGKSFPLRHLGERVPTPLPTAGRMGMITDKVPSLSVYLLGKIQSRHLSEFFVDCETSWRTILRNVCGFIGKVGVARATRRRHHSHFLDVSQDKVSL